MNNQIETFFNYLLDTETTSEIVFIDNVQKNTEYFQGHYFKDWERLVLRKLQQVHRNDNTSTLKNSDVSPKSENETPEETSTSLSSDEDDDDDSDSKSSLSGHVSFYFI